jgi:hypothetical protein
LKEFISFVRKISNGGLFPRFAMLVLLSMCQSQRFTRLILGIIKDHLCGLLKDQAMIRETEYKIDVPTYEQLSEYLKMLIDRLKVISDTAITFLIKVSIDLLSANGFKQAPELGQLVLSEIFKRKPIARKEILYSLMKEIKSSPNYSVYSTFLLYVDYVDERTMLDLVSILSDLAHTNPPRMFEDLCEKMAVRASKELIVLVASLPSMNDSSAVPFELIKSNPRLIPRFLCSSHARLNLYEKALQSIDPGATMVYFLFQHVPTVLPHARLYF